MLLGLLARVWTNYLKIKSLQDTGVATSVLRKQLGMQPWVFNKYLEATRNYDKSHLARGCLEILAVDSRLKNRSAGSAALFSELAYSLRASA